MIKEFYEKYKEWFDQPGHVLMGAGLSFIVAVFLAKSIFWLWAFIIGGLVSRVTWSVREALQHKRLILWNMDLAFIDLGIILGLIGAFLYEVL